MSYVFTDEKPFYTSDITATICLKLGLEVCVRD